LRQDSLLLWVGQTPVPQNVQDAARDIAELRPYQEDRSLSEQLGTGTIALVALDGRSTDPHYVSSLLDELQESAAVAIFLLPRDALTARRMIADHKTHFLCVDEDAPCEKLAIHLAAAAAFQPGITKLHTQLSAAHDLKAQADLTIEEMDEEMRLAARLQRDFLPRRLPEVGPARFGVLYRPASWVSGDIYDVVRLDETHVGFYVADVVGHGMPAALLTMFIKKAMQTKRIVGHTYEIIPPHISLKELNTDICEQDLPSCQFCTAVYCVLDTESLIVTYARGGHPEPVVLHPNGDIETLWTDGSLLGIFSQEEYTSSQYQLQKGDRLLVYTDGAEELFRRGPGGEMCTSEQSFKRWTNMNREEMLLHLTSGAESWGDVPPPKDDITVLVLDIEG